MAGNEGQGRHLSRKIAVYYRSNISAGFLQKKTTILNIRFFPYTVNRDFAYYELNVLKNLANFVVIKFLISRTF